jgi:hypothetical protein
MPPPDFTSFHPGYETLCGSLPAKKEGKRNAGRRGPYHPHAYSVRGAPRKERLAPRLPLSGARLPAFRLGSSQGGVWSLGATRARLRGCFANVADMTAGLSPHFQRRTPHTGRNAGRHSPPGRRRRLASAGDSKRTISGTSTLPGYPLTGRARYWDASHRD